MNEAAQQLAGASLASNPVRRADTILHASFVLTGAVSTLLGPILPVLSAKWSLLDSQAGFLFAAQFAGSMAGVGLSSPLILRFGARRLLAIGFGMMAAGVALLGVGAWRLAAGSVLCYGVGLGLTIPTTNLLVSAANATRAAAALSILNFAWVAGAVVCPVLVAGLAPHDATGIGLLGLAGLLAGFALIFARTPFHLPAKVPGGQPGAPLGTSPWRSPLIPVLGLLFFLYVGTENAIGGWAASYANRFHSGPGTLWALTPSCFWAAMLVGRAAAPAVLRFTPDAKVMTTGLVIAALGVTTLLVTPTVVGVFVGASLTGLGLAPVFPITIAMLSHDFGVLASRLAGSMFALAALGGATMPWLVGFFSTRFTSLRLGLIVPLIGMFMMLAAHFAHAGVSARS